jgi:hypothetical protein
MSLHNWVETNVQYGRKLAGSSMEGANSGREKFLQGEPLAPFLSEAALRALKHAAAGVCLGILVASLSRNRRSARRALACGALGGAIGFGAGLTWRTRRLAASMGRGAFKKMTGVRDERWLERHPIDYA